MKFESLNELVKHAISTEYKVQIYREMLNTKNGKQEFNKVIRAKVQNQIGVYLWENSKTKEILYIGMAGKVKPNGEFVNHSVQKRLLASRGKDLLGKDIQTNQYIKDILNQDNIEELNIHVFHLKENQIPGYIEAVLINAYFQENKCLPRYNSNF